METGRLFHARPACIAALGLISGIFASAFCGEAFFYAPLISIFLALLCHRFGRTALAVFLLFSSLGFARMEATVPPVFTEGIYTLTGTVTSVSERNGETTLLVANAALSSAGLPHRAQLTLDSGELLAEPVPGQGVTARVYAKTVPRDDFYARYALVSADCAPMPDGLSFDLPKATFLSVLDSVRKAAGERIDVLFPSSGGLARAMLLGDKRAMAKEVSEPLYGAGIGHLVAVSGLHAGILAAALGKLLPVRRARLRFVLLFLFLAFYALVTALSPSVLRAGLMLLCVEGAGLFERRRDLPSSLAFAAVMILLFRPAALFSAGFALSFLAIYGFVTVCAPLENFFRPLGKCGGPLLAASVAVTLSTLPVSAYFFKSVSPVSIVVNCVVLPLAPCFLVPAAAALVLSIPFLPLGKLIALPARLALFLIAKSAALFSAEALFLPRPGGLAMLLFLLALLFASPLCLRDAKTRAILALSTLAISLLCWASQAII